MISTPALTECLLNLALQRSLAGFQQALKRTLDQFALSGWAVIFPPTTAVDGRPVFIAHGIKSAGSPLLAVASKQGFEAIFPTQGLTARIITTLAREISPDPSHRCRVLRTKREKGGEFVLFCYRPGTAEDFSALEIEILSQVGRLLDRCFVALARQQEQEFFGGLFKLVCDLHPDGLCVLDQRRRPILENKLFRTHMLVWTRGAEAVAQVNLPKLTLLPAVWQQACDEAFAAYQRNPLSPAARLVVSHGPVVFLEQKVNPVETLEGTVRYLAFQNTLGAIPYVLLTSSQKRSHARRLPSLERLAEQHRFSAREVEVARLVLEGASAAEIVERLKVAMPTVKTHIRHLLQKSGVKTRLQFVSLCHR